MILVPGMRGSRELQATEERVASKLETTFFLSQEPPGAMSCSPGDRRQPWGGPASCSRRMSCSAQVAETWQIQSPQLQFPWLRCDQAALALRDGMGPGSVLPTPPQAIAQGF